MMTLTPLDMRGRTSLRTRCVRQTAEQPLHDAEVSIVLCYHAVSREWDDPLAIAPEKLERQVAAALRWHPGRVHVTFDDGFRGVRGALPVLERLGVPATVFVCTDFVGGTLDLPPFESIAAQHRHELSTLSWDELREAAERGLDVGSHTRRHLDLRGLSDEALRDELTESREEIENHLGRRCRYLAYPYGQSDTRVQAAAERAGYDAAFGLVGAGKLGGRFGIPRVDPSTRDGALRIGFKSSRLWPVVLPPLRRLRGLRARLT
jgi:peptidoglycan/xylan/chitin deacetylase (PgdA/CDA1 family)